MTLIDLDELITQNFPSSAFPNVDEETLVQIFKAYSLGFKDGYSKRNSDATVKVVRNPTLGDLLYAANKKGS